MTKPRQIKLNGNASLTIVWNDGTVHNYDLKFLREESPDAGNKGETILGKYYPPPEQGPDKPGKYELVDIQPVGDYAVRLTWKDGYDYGIYSWELLWRLGEYLQVKNNLHQDFEDHHD